MNTRTLSTTHKRRLATVLGVLAMVTGIIFGSHSDTSFAALNTDPCPGSSASFGNYSTTNPNGWLFTFENSYTPTILGLLINSVNSLTSSANTLPFPATGTALTATATFGATFTGQFELQVLAAAPSTTVYTSVNVAATATPTVSAITVNWTPTAAQLAEVLANGYRLRLVSKDGVVPEVGINGQLQTITASYTCGTTPPVVVPPTAAPTTSTTTTSTTTTTTTTTAVPLVFPTIPQPTAPSTTAAPTTVAPTVPPTAAPTTTAAPVTVPAVVLAVTTPTTTPPNISGVEVEEPAYTGSTHSMFPVGLVCLGFGTMLLSLSRIRRRPNVQ
jgi:hypothetical protein